MTFEKALTALAAIATIGFVAAAVTAGGREPPSSGTRATADAAPVVLVRADPRRVPVRERPKTETSTIATEVRYVVKPGDTLWGIAARNYENVTDGMRRIKKRNGLRREAVLAGEVLVLPVGGRR
jgi:LysM repeat protein